LENSIGRVVGFVRGHIIVCVLARHFSLDWQQIADGSNDCLGQVANLCSQSGHEAREQVPGPGSYSDMLMMHQANEVVEDLGDVLLLRLKESVIPNANLQVLEKDGRMREINNV